MTRRRLRSFPSVCLVLMVGILGLSAQAGDLTPLRQYEPVLLRGYDFSAWVGAADINNIRLYVYENGQFNLIPFQIDKRRMVELKQNVNEAELPPIEKPALLKFLEICEYTYFEAVHPGSEHDFPFASDLLSAWDEIVFMVFDADRGAQRAPHSWSDSNLDPRRYEIQLTDSRNEEQRFVYAYRWHADPPALLDTDYVSYEQDQGTCHNSSPNGTACGTAWGRRSGQPLAGKDVDATYRTHFSKNWVTDLFEVGDVTGAWPATPDPDLLNRIQYKSGAEDENDWSNPGVAAPVFHDVKDGPIRVIRGVQGAVSGVATTKYEFMYPTQFVTQVNLRVHDIPDIYIRMNHDQGLLGDSVLNPAYVWSQDRFESSNQNMDKIDGGGNDSSIGGAHGDWFEVPTPFKGTYAGLFEEERPICAAETGLDYADTSALVGTHSRKWLQLAWHQDAYGKNKQPINNGGCDDPSDPTDLHPESEELLFARLRTTLIPQPDRADPKDDALSIKADDFQANLDSPMQVRTQSQTQSPPPPPDPPLAPGLVGTGQDDGTVHLDLSAGEGSGPIVGFRVYRSDIGVGNWKFIGDVDPGNVYVDRHVKAGRSYDYRARAFDDVNQESPDSTAVTVAVTDNTPPCRRRSTWSAFLETTPLP